MTPTRRRAATAFIVDYYANVVLKGPDQTELVTWLRERGEVAYVSPMVNGATVVYPSDLSGQEALARELSRAFDCPALVVMVFARRVMLYQLYASGALSDSYVSEHVDELLGASDAPPGNAEALCDAFAKPSAARRVATVLAKPAKDGQPYAYAANRHGELLTALGLPLFAVNASFDAIERGELPAGSGFDPRRLVRTG